MWSYHSRKEDPEATVTILKVESLPKIGVIVHIRMDGIHLRVRSCSGDSDVTEIQHAPFTREALDKSVVKLLRTGEPPDFQWGYRNWLSHCGGVYTLTVADVVAADQVTFDEKMGCRSQSHDKSKGRTPESAAFV